MTYKLIRSKRKTIAIYITQDAEIDVRAPMRTPRAEIDAFILSKQKWIEKNLGEMLRRRTARENFTLKIGNKALLIGKLYPITAKIGDRAGFDGENFYVPHEADSAAIKEVIIKVYKKVADHYIKAKVAEYAQFMNVVPTAVRITGAKTRWGSCSGKNSLNFSYRLITAEEDVIDYVIVHELAHILEHNHSMKFWSHVSSVLPDYKQRQRKLCELHRFLTSTGF